ncbi:MAG: hypothetical protein ACXAEU_23880 [Candidatus Hodarchaeales archaeon]|jgi:tetrahydromethanopterin S-methyltransferase subunit G
MFLRGQMPYRDYATACLQRAEAAEAKLEQIKAKVKAKKVKTIEIKTTSKLARLLNVIRGLVLGIFLLLILNIVSWTVNHQ